MVGEKGVRGQHHFDTKNSNIFFSAKREIYGSAKPSTTQLLSADGFTLFKGEKNSISKRRREHFSNLLNRPLTVDPTVLDQIPRRPTVDSSGKAPEIDGIPAELSKSLRPEAPEAIQNILTIIWEKENMSKEFRDVTIILLFKNKGSKTDCSNY